MRLKGKVAIVTGASRGIGKAIALRFAAEGAIVIVNYTKSAEKSAAVVDEIRKQGGQAIHVQGDVSIAAGVKNIIQTTLKAFGRIDILVNNAGVLIPEEFPQTNETTWDKTIDVNLKGAYLCCKEVVPVMLRQKKGKIINISSNSGLYHPSAMRYVEYVASKAGMNGLTKALALKFGPYITVNAICPGYIKTEMVEQEDQETERKLLEETAAKRFGKPEEVASAVVFLASEEAEFITGELLIVAGGRGMH